MAKYILAHDLGTTGNKASLFDAEGKALASAFVGYETAYPHATWAEQDPADWWRAICDSSQELLTRANVPASDVAVIAFSGQMMGCLPVDDKGKPLRSSIIWADMRAVEEARFLAEKCGADEVYRRSGHRAVSSYSAAKILWVRNHQPDIFARTHKILHAKDYAVYKLTGQFATDCSDASGTNLLDLDRMAWAEDILEAIELDINLLPEPYPSSQVVGQVTAAAEEETGLAQGTPVVIGGGDGACATTGAGAVNEGDAYNYIGSSAWISVVTRRPIYDPQKRTFTFVCLDPAFFFPTGTMQAAGGSYGWLERVWRGEEDEESLYRAMDAEAAGVEPGAERLIFLPYLIGERSPHWNPRARAAFVGLTMRHGRAEMARAVLEGVAFNLRIILDALREQGVQIPAIRLIGGGAKSALWRQILADVFGLPVLRPTLLAEATSLGAAIAGGVGVGLFPDFGVAARLVEVSEGEKPDPNLKERYGKLYNIFQDTYRALEPLYERLAQTT